MSHAHKVMTSSIKMDFGTPPEFLDLVRQVGRIGLDPCTVAENPTGAAWWLCPPGGDGLGADWTGYADLVFVNPPYGRSLWPWARKMATEGAKGAEIVGLVPARTGARWFRELATADVLCFYAGRLTFWQDHAVTGVYGPTQTINKKKSAVLGRDVWEVTSAAFDVVVPYWGPRRERFLEIFRPLSTLVVEGPPRA